MDRKADFAMSFGPYKWIDALLTMLTGHFFLWTRLDDACL